MESIFFLSMCVTSNLHANTWVELRIPDVADPLVVFCQHSIETFKKFICKQSDQMDAAEGLHHAPLLAAVLHARCLYTEYSEALGLSADGVGHTP